MIEYLNNDGVLITPLPAIVRRRERLIEAIDTYPPAYLECVWLGFERACINRGSIHAHAPMRYSTGGVAFSAWHEGYRAYGVMDFGKAEFAA